jgi:general secretion pathway protein K
VRTGWPPRRQNGFALIVVLNVIVILSAIAILAAHGSREEAAISANFRTATQRQSLAEGAMVFAAYQLLSDVPDRNWLPDGRPNRLTLFGTEMTVSIQDESGKLSLNMTDEAKLAQAFANAGIEVTKARSLAAAIADWRDPDDSRRLGGAERQDYLQAGISGSPANAPFSRMDELLGVLGVTNDNYKKIASLVSAYSTDREVNLDVAPPLVLTALFGPGSPEIAAILGRRSSVLTGNQTSTLLSAPPRRNGPSSQNSPAKATTTYSILVTLVGAATPAPIYRGAFRIIPDPHGPRLAIVENIKLIGPDDPH